MEVKEALLLSVLVVLILVLGHSHMIRRREKKEQDIKEQIVKYQDRIDFLESKICNEDHKWVLVNRLYLDDNGTIKYLYRCKKCGKFLETIQPFMDTDNNTKEEGEVKKGEET